MPLRHRRSRNCNSSERARRSGDGPHHSSDPFVMCSDGDECERRGPRTPTSWGMGVAAGDGGGGDGTPSRSDDDSLPPPTSWEASSDRAGTETDASDSSKDGDNGGNYRRGPPDGGPPDGGSPPTDSSVTSTRNWASLAPNQPHTGHPIFKFVFPPMGLALAAVTRTPGVSPPLPFLARCQPKSHPTSTRQQLGNMKRAASVTRQKWRVTMVRRYSHKANKH